MMDTKITTTKSESPLEGDFERIAKESTLENAKDQERISQIKKNKQKRMRKIILSLFGVSVFFILTTIYSQYQVYVLKKLENVNNIINSEVPVTPNQIIEAVSRHILLPDTIPQIAAIEDAKKLSTTQDFFRNALNGDVVIVYETTIIVYRPSQDLLIAVGDVSGTSK